MACSSLEQIYTELKKQLSSLLISSSKGVNIKQLQKDYREFIGGEIPFKQLGFHTLEEYLKSVPDICRLAKSGYEILVIPVITEKSKHINELIVRQKQPKQSSRPPRRNADMRYNRYVPHNTFRKPHDLKITTIDSNKKVLPPPHDYFLENSQRKTLPQKKYENKNDIRSTNHYGSYCDNRIEKSSSANKVINTCDNTSKKTSENKEHIEKPWISDIQTNTKSTDHFYPYLENESDDDSEAEFFEQENDSDDYFEYKSDAEEISCSVNKLTLTSNPPVLDSPLIDESHVSRINKKVKEKLRLLIQDYPDGIWCSKLLRLYEKKYKQKLDPFNFGFESVIQMCDDLPDIFHCIRPNRTDWKIYDVTKPIPDIHTMREFCKYLQTLPLPNEQHNNEPPLPDDMMYAMPNYKYPEDVLHPDEIIPRQFLINNEKPGEYLELLVAEVYDPSKFWIQLKGPSTMDALHSIMDEMQIFYKYSAKDLLLNEFNVRIGLMCAALYQNEYHRAIILKIFDDNTIKIFYCDYGTVSLVEVHKTYLLHRKFSELPMQAIRARLANIIPKEQNTMWSREAANLMLELTREKDLIGYIESINYELEILDLIVTDTTHPEIDIHINDVLIENDFAELGHEAPLCTTSSAIIPNVHLYPAFEELENAIYPTVSEVITMLKLGHTYETIFHGYFQTSPDNIQTHIHLNNTSIIPPDEYTYSTNDIVSNSITKIKKEFIHEKPDKYYSKERNEEFNKQQISDDNVVQETCNTPSLTNDQITTDSKLLLDKNQDVIESRKLQTYNENMQIQKKESVANYPRTNKPPPGFENVIPRNKNFPNCGNFVGAPIISKPNISGPNLPLIHNHLPPITDYSNVSAINMLLMTNPMLHNEIMLNQQRETILQRVKMIENYQKLEALRRQQMFYSQSRNLQYMYHLQNVQNNPNSLQSGSIDGSIRQTEISKQVTYPELQYSTKNSDSISHFSEHICERFVIKLQIQDCSFHVLKIENEYYVTLQDIITNLLKLNLSWKNWLKSVNIDVNSFPNKLISLDKYEHVYNEVKRYSIPGINTTSNLGCNVRLTTLDQVICIFKKFGNTSLITELSSKIANVMKNPEVWQVLISSD